MDRERIISLLVWDDRALEVAHHWGLEIADVEAIIRHDAVPTLDAHSTDAGHPIVRFRRGDVIVVVGFRDPDAPKVLHVHTITDRPAAGRLGGKTRASAGTGPGTGLPSGYRDMKRRILALGYRFEVAGSGHLAVIDRDTGRRIATISSTPRPGRGIADEWKRFLGAHNRNITDKE